MVTAMSVRLRFLSSGDAGAVGVVGRSASFAGFSSAQSRRIAKSIHGNSVRARMPAKSSKMYGTLRKGSVCPDPKPQQVKKIFEALKRGLKEYLCTQQAELDYLSGRHKDTRRNSRLAFYYDLDKQTRSVERHIRKMEFHISKVDELYEGYCIQCRLRDGASNMQRAFSRCPPSRASRESLQELGRSLQECTEDMWLIEGALEVHLGEFHIRMKGFVGYARLCPGDQYEVLMRLGRQRWKLKGRIESDDSQTWEEEEKVFIPTLHENLEIKVTELRGLSSLAVGTVTCDITDFFTTRPQVIVVDITELGTIKLQLEVLWNPFDTESFLVSPSPTGKFSMGSRKGSLYNWTPPSTPSFRERYYLPRGARQEHASSESLMECILESFAFLNADLAPQELSLCGGCQGPSSTRQDTQYISSSPLTIPPSIPVSRPSFLRPRARPPPRGQRGAGKDRSPPPLPARTASPRELTAGTPELDMLLTVHLHVCKTLLQKLASPNLSRMVQECLLEEAVQQKQVLEMLSVLDFEKVSKAASIEEIVPQATRRKGCLKLWRGCTEPGRVLSCSGTTLLNQLKKTFLHRVRGKYPGQLETACRRLLEQVVSCGGLLPGAGLPEEQTVTWFQFHSYLQRQGVSDLEKHFAQLTKEVTLAEELQCAGQVKTIRKLQGKRLGQLQPLPQTLRAWALLQLDGTPRVCRAASARLASAARNQSFREKALVFYTNALMENDGKLQQAACVALKHLRGIESIDQIASLCQSDLEAVRTAAREATLSFGKVQHQMLCAIQWGSRRPLEGCARGATVSPQRCKIIQRPSAVGDPCNCTWPRWVSFMVEVA
ncbi:RIPOR family member 3 isoform X5 [Neofelis nebulosa]|uniref:RIPOR family member 3 isoform X5 n=1 Tax=Neofelis nebulosa TaxID=61452 RepID=UPI00272C980A|nr:RIPOR family member 3 isoform X5 [Neofelis nebulosa]